MKITIRQENINDNNKVYNVVKKAFQRAIHSDRDEHNLINRLRESENYIPELSLVALVNKEIVGHIMFTKLSIINKEEKYESLALAPLAVTPEYQKKGVGSRLIQEGLEIAKDLGYNSVVVLGSDEYYPSFGFKEALKFEIKAPFEVPSKNFMAIELKENSLNGISGTVEYAKEFFEK